MVAVDKGQPLVCKFRRSIGRPICGDRVRISTDNGTEGVVEEILPRRNEFARADRRERKQLVASNLDRVVIVLAPRPEPSHDLIERYLVAAHSLDIKPVLVLNKADLWKSENDIPGPEVPLGRLSAYESLGYAVVQTSCKGPPGVAALKSALQNLTCILAGQSGVGKSSLINELIPDLDLQTGALSRATGKGTHTTTATTRYSLPEGGYLIDSPGVWEYGLWRLGQSELERGFVEFLPFLGLCHFNNCRHDSEPECAVIEATETGLIRRWRYESYLRLLIQST
jgi:ribosome biogenesis GTPase